MNETYTPPTILLVEEDDEVRPLLSQNLRNQGYHVIVALDEADAIERTKGGSFCPDLILLNQVGRSIEEYTVMGQRICKSAGIGSHTPIIVMAERYGADMEGKDVQVDEAEYVTYLEDGQQLMNLLHRLCPVKSELSETCTSTRENVAES
jgi:DNA-binding response OmpR family regulator